MYPAKGVDHFLGETLDLLTEDGVPEMLVEALDNTEYAEDGEAELVVELEGGVVNQALLVSDEVLEVPEHRQHVAAPDSVQCVKVLLIMCFSALRGGSQSIAMTGIYDNIYFIFRINYDSDSNSNPL